MKSKTIELQVEQGFYVEVTGLSSSPSIDDQSIRLSFGDVEILTEQGSHIDFLCSLGFVRWWDWPFNEDQTLNAQEFADFINQVDGPISGTMYVSNVKPKFNKDYYIEIAPDFESDWHNNGIFCAYYLTDDFVDGGAGKVCASEWGSAIDLFLQEQFDPKDGEEQILYVWLEL